MLGKFLLPCWFKVHLVQGLGVITKVLNITCDNSAIFVMIENVLNMKSISLRNIHLTWYVLRAVPLSIYDAQGRQ